MRPSLIVALPENTGLSSEPVTPAVSVAAPELRRSRKNPCRIPRLASPVAFTSIVLSCEVDAAGDAELRPVAAKFELADLGDVTVQVELDRSPSLLQLVVEQRQVEILDARFDDAAGRGWSARRRRGPCRRRPRW